MNETFPEKPTLEKLLELGGIHSQVRTDGETPFMVLPAGCAVQSLASYFPPPRIAQRVTMLEIGSFCDYVKQFQTGTSIVFANARTDGAEFLAVLDYHNPADKAPGRGTHQVHYATAPTPEFTTWLGHDGEQMSQETFAEFLEENPAMFSTPSGADLLELIQNLHGASNVSFTSGVRLDSGANKLNYEEEVKLASGKKGEIELPREIVAGIAPFIGAERYAIPARLKYRINGRELAIWYETIDMEKIIRDAILGLTKTVAMNTGLVPLLGRI